MTKFQPKYMLTGTDAGYHAICTLDGIVVSTTTTDDFGDSFCWVEDHYEQEFSWRAWPGAVIQ